MHRYKLIVSYDGTDFHGWQMQTDKKTVSSCMEKTFNRVFKTNASLVGASRTDAGVHALGQVARLRTDLNLNPNSIMQAWNSSLPKSILIRSIEKLDKKFHPCANVLQKTYYYHIFMKKPLPFVARYGWYTKYVNKLDLEKFNKCLKIYEGEHDFTSFFKLEKFEEKNPIRKIDSINLKSFSRYGILRVEIKGKSFLRFQIRRMVGYALDIARREDLGIDYLKNLLNTPNSQQKLLKADSSGLCLGKISYSENRSYPFDCV